MYQLLNTLYVTTDKAYLRLDHETLKVDVEGTTKLQVPLHHLGGIVCFGNVLVSPFLLHRCAEDGRAVVFLDHHGQFKARLEGPVSGNVLLRRAQHLAVSDSIKPPLIARNIVAGKIQNARQIVLRAARETDNPEDIAFFTECANTLLGLLASLESSTELEQMRGIEGNAARAYFSVLGRMVRVDREAFGMNGRSRRPPLDRMNALLSFLYTLLLSDCVAAAEAVGLDPQIGFLHALRPGRPALGLDLMEELRAVLADRLALTLINRQQITRDDFHQRPGGAVLLEDEARKTVVVAYQKRKQDEVQHPVLGQKVPFGLVPHIQARLLARYLRGDLSIYPPFLYR
ncbi:MAG: type I-C CRISPR-associated endonuclease Cas1c [Acidobacteriota bacterium]|nr:type I-C CRISPR-associated endonuclease Cas1c [Blastocatellia bacterium]MDW8241104.1 type I-C CRISPR-associated endonuclease Cas1c [Acidobacteriota bacterium]